MIYNTPNHSIRKQLHRYGQGKDPQVRYSPDDSIVSDVDQEIPDRLVVYRSHCGAFVAVIEATEGQSPCRHGSALHSRAAVLEQILSGIYSTYFDRTATQPFLSRPAY